MFMVNKFKIAVISFALVSLPVLSGCYTAKGFGKDLEKGGQAIQKAASEGTGGKNKAGGAVNSNSDNGNGDSY